MTKLMATFLVSVVLTYQPTLAQTANAQAVRHVLRDSHPCGLSASPSVFKTPSGTISYYDFISLLPNYFRENRGFDFLSSYDKENNSYRNVPTVVFVLGGFTPIEIGSVHKGRRGLVYISIRADECENIQMNLGSKTLRIGRITAHLRLSGTEGALPPDEVHTAISDWLVSHVVKKFADFSEDRKILVFAKPIGLSSQSTGELMDKMDLDFEIENYYIPEK